MEENVEILQKELTTKNAFLKAIMDTPKDLVNTLSNIQKKDSSQNLNKKITHCRCQQNQQPLPRNPQSQQKHFSSSHNQNNQQHHRQNKADQLLLPDQNSKNSHQPQAQKTSLYMGNLDQKKKMKKIYTNFLV